MRAPWAASLPQLNRRRRLGATPGPARLTQPHSAAKARGGPVQPDTASPPPPAPPPSTRVEPTHLLPTLDELHSHQLPSQRVPHQLCHAVAALANLLNLHPRRERGLRI